MQMVGRNSIDVTGNQESLLERERSVETGKQSFHALPNPWSFAFCGESFWASLVANMKSGLWLVRWIVGSLC